MRSSLAAGKSSARPPQLKPTTPISEVSASASDFANPIRKESLCYISRRKLRWKMRIDTIEVK